MSRIRGIEAKVQKEILQTRNGWNETKQTNDGKPVTKEDVEQREIAELVSKLPALSAALQVHRKIGSGTFSSVYLGSPRAQAALPPPQRRWFAIKHLVPTAHPARVEHELRCLQDMGGRNNVIGVDLCLRNFDTIVFIMPYIPHRKFSEYVGEMDAAELRQYMQALLTALRHVHSFGVIHRDVKPSNFLYDRDNKRFLLVDFGLAQRVVPAPSPPPPPPPAHAASVAKRARELDPKSVPVESAAKRRALDLRVRPAAPPPPPPPAHNTRSGAPSPSPAGAPCACACAGAGALCGVCAARPAPRAPRAGTQGFRPPEVLLKCPLQTCAVDTWAAGVVLAACLAARYPFFRAPDDARALAELCDLLGTGALQRAACAMGRRLITSTTRRGLCLRKLAVRLRGGGGGGGGGGTCTNCEGCRLPTADCLCRGNRPGREFTPGVEVAGFPDAAFGLCAALLEPDPRLRLSAARALRHPFITGTDR